MRILVIHGPNLELLGARAPEHYGLQTLDDINAAMTALGRELGAAVDAVQHNEEEALVGAVREAAGNYDGLVINPGCYTHTSTALAAALKDAALPYVEVHLSNPYAREAFRHRSYVAAGATARIMGFKGDSYLLALRGLARRLAAPDV